MLDENGAVDPIVYDLWHVISAIDDLIPGKVEQTRLLGETLHFVLDETGDAKSGAVAQTRPLEPRRFRLRSSMATYGLFWGPPAETYSTFPNLQSRGVGT